MRPLGEGARRFARACLVVVLALGGADAEAQRSPDGTDDAGGADMPGFARPAYERVDRVLNELAARGIHPEIGSIVSGSGLAGGASLRTDSLGREHLGGEIGGAWSVRGYSAYQARLGLLGRAGDTLGLEPADANVTHFATDSRSTAPGFAAYVDGRHLRAPRVDFFGLGPSTAATRTDFGLSTWGLDLVAQWQPRSHAGLAIRTGVLRVDVGPGTNEALPNLEDRFGEAAAPGLSDDVMWLTTGLLAALDGRDDPDVPTRGTFVGLALWRFTPTGGGAPFTRAMLDLRVFRPLGSASHVAAARVLAAADSGADEGPTPFHLQNWLGGSHSLRGFGSYRFRGEALAHVSVEYRWRAFSRLDVVAFVDAGTVAGAVSRLALSDVHATPGVGIRVRTDARLLSRVDWAHGSAGHRVLWSLSPSF